MIIVTGFERADAIAALIVVVLMLHAAWGLLRETGRILLEAAPEGFDTTLQVDHAPDDLLTIGATP